MIDLAYVLWSINICCCEMLQFASLILVLVVVVVVVVVTCSEMVVDPLLVAEVAWEFVFRKEELVV